MLLKKLETLSGDAFYAALADNHTTMEIEHRMCADCKAMHDGCPTQDDDAPCVISTAEWLEMPCRNEPKEEAMTT